MEPDTPLAGLPSSSTYTTPTLAVRPSTTCATTSPVGIPVKCEMYDSPNPRDWYHPSITFLIAAMVSMVNAWPLNAASLASTSETTVLGSTRAPSTAKVLISG